MSYIAFLDSMKMPKLFPNHNQIIPKSRPNHSQNILCMYHMCIICGSYVYHVCIHVYHVYMSLACIIRRYHMEMWYGDIIYVYIISMISYICICHVYVLLVCITYVSQIRNPRLRLPDLESPSRIPWFGLPQSDSPDSDSPESDSPSRTPWVGYKNIKDAPHSPDHFFSWVSSQNPNFEGWNIEIL